MLVVVVVLVAGDGTECKTGCLVLVMVEAAAGNEGKGNEAGE